MSDITYRHAVMEDFDRCLDVIYEAFKDYPAYCHFKLKTQQQQNEFTRSLIYVQLYEGFKKDTVIVSERDNEILCVSIIQKPGRKETTVFEYMFYGAPTVFLKGGVTTTFKFLNLFRDFNSCHVNYAETHPDCWNMELIAVNTKFHHQGIGSRMIQDYIIPMVKEGAGKKLTLITNKEINTHFYEKNGFSLMEEVKEHTLDDHTLYNWTFEQNF